MRKKKTIFKMEIFDSTAKIVTNIFSWYALFLLICGTIGNIFASVVCFQIKNSTFKILRILMIFEVISLYTVILTFKAFHLYVK